jgi:aryl-alcohol dehydrogenase-like predicted oxidoreductase
MQYRNLGSSGLKVSTIGLGTNQFGGKVDQDTVTKILSAAIDQGINLIDTADIYQKGRSEETIGKALRGRREQVLIATKVYFATGEGPNQRGASRFHILEGVEASLRRLDTDTIDLYQIHRWDAETPIEETLRALDDLATQGKVRYIGSSNFASWQIAHSAHVAKDNHWHAFVSEQPHYHMLARELEKDILPAAEYFGIGILPYFPLAGGFLTGKYKRGEPIPAGSRGETSQYVKDYLNEENFDILEKLAAFAGARDHTIGELAHAWLLAHPQVSSVISGATRVEHLLANAKAGDWELSADELAEVNAILEYKTETDYLR